MKPPLHREIIEVQSKQLHGVLYSFQFPFSLPEGRHSHSSINIDSGIIIAGGLTQNMRPVLNPVVIKNFASGWCLCPIKLDCLVSSRQVSEVLGVNTSLRRLV